MSTDKLHEFKAWLSETGRSYGTTEGYAQNVATARLHPDPVQVLRRRLSASTLHRYRAALIQWARFTNDVELERRLKLFKLPPPRRASHEDPYTEDEWRRMVKALANPGIEMHPAVRACIGFMLMRGLRVGDVLRIERKRLVESLKTKSLTYYAKGNKELAINIEPVRLWCAVLLRYDGWLRAVDLVSKSKAPVEFDRIASARARVFTGLKFLAKEAGINADFIHPHRLRRTYAVMFLDEVKDINQLRDHMGWASITTAAVYADHSQRKKLDAQADQMLKRILGGGEKEESK